VDRSEWRWALQDSLNCVTIRTTADAPGYLMLADIWYPGCWRPHCFAASWTTRGVCSILV
jgi:hypothetical protein